MAGVITSKSKLRNKAGELLAIADIEINGSRPWDIQILNENFFTKVLSKGSVGLGESYMDNWWQVDQLDEFFTKLLSANIDQHASVKNIGWDIIRAKLFNQQTQRQAFANAQHHYDAGNDIYQRMLDKRMIYSCGYWKNARNLDEAQEHKLDLACKKLYLEPGMRLLDVGCGWGETARFAAEKYGVEVVGVTVSKDQYKIAKEKNRSLPVEIRLQDFRDLKEKFDRIVSIGMFEHVGCKNYRTYFSKMKENLKSDGLFLLHTIGSNLSVSNIDEWIGKYIFPNAMLPSVRQIGETSEGEFVLEDWHNFGPDYDKTLMAWYKNFNTSWDDLKDKYGERFYRMWEYYLLSCAGSFRSRKNQLWQIVFSPEGMPGGYVTVR